jgi:hypothetical protein
MRVALDGCGDPPTVILRLGDRVRSFGHDVIHCAGLATFSGPGHCCAVSKASDHGKISKIFSESAS